MTRTGSAAARAALLLLVAASAWSCGNGQPQAPTETPLEAQTNPNLKHFGFTLVDVGYDDPLDSATKTNYADEVADFTNMADVVAFAPDDDLRGKIQALNAQGLKALIHLHELFFEADGSDAPSTADFKLRSDYRQRWETFQARNAAVLTAVATQALYAGEEPTWNGITFAELEAATDLLKARVPDVPILVVEAHPIVGELRVPTSVDWLATDHYFLKHPKTDPEFLAELATLKSKRSAAHQKVVLVMDTFYIPSLHGGVVGISQADMAKVAAEYYSLAVNDPEVVGIIGYVWPGGFDDPNALGARQLPAEVRAVYRRIGRLILNK